jgi:hypothetical protein
MRFPLICMNFASSLNIWIELNEFRKLKKIKPLLGRNQSTASTPTDRRPATSPSWKAKVGLSAWPSRQPIRPTTPSAAECTRDVVTGFAFPVLKHSYSLRYRELASLVCWESQSFVAALTLQLPSRAYRLFCLATASGSDQDGVWSVVSFVLLVVLVMAKWGYS